MFSYYLWHDTCSKRHSFSLKYSLAISFCFRIPCGTRCEHVRCVEDWTCFYHVLIKSKAFEKCNVFSGNYNWRMDAYRRPRYWNKAKLLFSVYSIYLRLPKIKLPKMLLRQAEVSHYDWLNTNRRFRDDGTVLTTIFVDFPLPTNNKVHSVSVSFGKISTSC